MMNLFSRPSGGYISDLVARRWGMRGRLWALFIIQSLGGLFCLLLGLTSNSLGATMAILVIFSIFCQQSCGLSFGVVPFISKRSTGLVSGFVGSGGNVGGAVTQALFFTYLPLSTYRGFLWMGVMTIGVTLLYLTMYFPMWGGCFAAAKEGVSEEDYYLAEWTPEERAQVHGWRLLRSVPSCCDWLHLDVLHSKSRQNSHGSSSSADMLSSTSPKYDSLQCGVTVTCSSVFGLVACVWILALSFTKL